MVALLAYYKVRPRLVRRREKAAVELEPAPMKPQDSIIIPEVIAEDPRPPTPTVMREEPGPLAGTSRRNMLIEDVFCRLDASRAGYLSCTNLQRFGKFVGFNGDDEAWRLEFLDLCKYLGCDPVLGLSFDAFSELVNDRSPEDGCYCSNEELLAFKTAGAAAPNIAGSVRQPLTQSRAQPARDAIEGVYLELDYAR